MEPQIVTNEQVAEKLKSKENTVLLDVREIFEFEFSHVPQAINIPLGDLSGRYGELDQNKEILIICRTGNRSDMAARYLMQLGFEKVYNVLPGMIQWAGEVEENNASF